MKGQASADRPGFRTPGRQRQRGWWYPWIFVGGMLLVVVVNIGMAVTAVSTFPGLETEDAYRKGLAYNKTLAAAEAQAARGWQVEISFVEDIPGAVTRGGELQARFLDRNGNPLDHLTITASLARPLGPVDRHSMDLAARGGGLYAAHVALPLAGQWEAQVLADGNGDRYQASRRLLLP